MKALKIRNGDLQISDSGSLDFVFKRDRVLRDIELWLREPMGQGFIDDSFGSELPDLIGTKDIQSLKLKVDSEIRRIITRYQSYQLEKLKQAKERGKLRFWSKGEIIEEIKDVRINYRLDTLYVFVILRFLGGEDNVAVNITITDEGVTVTE